MKKRKVFASLLTVSALLAVSSAAYADSIQHTLSGNAGTTVTYHSAVSDGTNGADYSYMHGEKVYEDSSSKITFKRVETYAGESSPSGSEFYNYQIVDVYGGGAGTKTQFIGELVEDGFTLSTGVTLRNTSSKTAYTRALVCADPDGCSGSSSNFVYDTWVYKPASTFRALDDSKSASDDGEVKEFKVIQERTVAKKSNLKKVKDNVDDFAGPHYVPSFMGEEIVELIEPPSVIEDKKLRDQLNQWEIKYKSSVDDSYIQLSLTKGGNGILGDSEELEINGKKAQIQEKGKYITLSWKHKGNSYWLLAKTSDELTKDEVIKFASSIE